MRSVCVYRMKEKKTIFKPLAGIEPHIFAYLVRRINHYTTRTNHTNKLPLGISPILFWETNLTPTILKQNQLSMPKVSLCDNRCHLLYKWRSEFVFVRQDFIGSFLEKVANKLRLSQAA